MKLQADLYFKLLEHAKKEAEDGDLVQALRFYRLAILEFRKQFHREKTRRIADRMTRLMFKIELNGDHPYFINTNL